MRTDITNREQNVIIVASVIALVIITIFSSVDRDTLNLAAQSLLSMVGFLAGASMVVTSFYMGQVLKAVPETAEKFVPSMKTVINRTVPQLVPELERMREEDGSAEEVWKAIFASLAVAFKGAWEEWSKSLERFMEFPRTLRKAGSQIILFLVVSAFLSVLTILSGWVYMLGLSFACVIVAVETLFRSWKNAERSIEGFLFLASMVEFFESFKDADNKDKQD